MYLFQKRLNRRRVTKQFDFTVKGKLMLMIKMIEQDQ